MRWIIQHLYRALMGPSLGRAAGADACGVSGCAAAALVTVASHGSARTMMCGPHARRWVAWDGCWRVAEDTTGGIETRLGHWLAGAQASGSEASWRQSLRAL